MAYIEFWKRWRDFSGKTSRGDFWTAILTHVFLSFFLIIAVCILLVGVFGLETEKALYYIEIFWNIFGTIWLVPFCAMSVRRLRDVGYNRNNFWKLLIPGIVILSLFLSSVDESNDETKKP